MSKKSKSTKKTKEPTPKPTLPLDLILPLLMTLLSILIFANSLGNGFVYDDYPTIVEDSDIRSPRSIASHLPFWYCRLLRDVTYIIDYSIWQLNPFGYHLTNLLLHILCTNLLYLLINLMFKNKRLAFFTGLLFAAHPVHIEAVSAIANRKELLAMLFYTLAFICYIKKGWYLLLAGLSYLLAISAKEVAAIALPVVCLFYELTMTKDILVRIRKNLRYYLAGSILVSLVVGFIFIKLDILNFAFSSKHIFYISMGRTESYLPILVTVGKCLLQYIGLLLFPFNLCFDHYTQIPKSCLSFEGLISIGLLLSLFFMPKLYRYSRPIFFGLGWFLINWLPISNIIPLICYFLVERYMYVPSVGFCFILALLINQMYQSKPRIAMGLLGVILAIYSVIVINRNGDYRSEYTLSLKTIQQNPNSTMAHYALGQYYIEKGKLDQAIGEGKKILRIDPHYYHAYYLLGSAYHQSGQDNESIKYLSQATEDIEACNLLGVIYEKRGNFEKAIGQLKQALKIDPNSKKAYNNLGVVYEKMHQIDKAIEMYKQAIDKASDYAKPYESLARIYIRKGELNDALRVSQKAVKLNPSSFNFYVLGCLYYKNGFYHEAESALKEAVRLSPQTPLYSKTLAAIQK